MGSGEPFRRVDNWTTRKDAHRVLSAAWTGRTRLSYKQVEHVPQQQQQQQQQQLQKVSGFVMSFSEILAPREHEPRPGCHGERPSVTAGRRARARAASGPSSGELLERDVQRPGGEARGWAPVAPMRRGPSGPHMHVYDRHIGHNFDIYTPCIYSFTIFSSFYKDFRFITQSTRQSTLQPVALRPEAVGGLRRFTLL